MLKTAEQADAMSEIAEKGFTRQPEGTQLWLKEQGYIEPMISGRQRWTLTPKGLVVMRAHGYRGTPNYCRNPGLHSERPVRAFKSTTLKGNPNADKRTQD